MHDVLDVCDSINEHGRLNRGIEEDRKYRLE
jgi:hypothetical protein